MMMILNIVLNCIAGNFVPNSPNKISIFPKLTAPQLFFNIWIFPKNLFCTHTLESSYNLTYRIFRRDTRENMNVILGNLQLDNLTVSYCQNLIKQLANCVPNFVFNNKLPIFRRPHKMISCIVNCTAQSFYAHTDYYTKTLYN